MGEITASDIVRQAMAKLSTLNIDGPEAVAAAAQALNDMHKAGGLRVRPPVSHTATVSTPIKGWNFKPDEGETPFGRGRLVRAKDDVSILASANCCLWEKQILDFEFTEGTQWTGDQIKAMVGASGGGSGDRMMCISYVASPADLGGNPPTPEILASGPDGGTVVVTSGTLQMPTYYDIGYDERLPVTQAIVDNMESSIQRLIADRNQQSKIRNDQAAEIALLRQALLHILGDMPSPMEDPYERCRKIAANALGYQDPGPMELAGREHQRACILNMEVERLHSIIASLGKCGVAQNDEIALLRQALAMKDARIAQLDTRLAATPVAFEELDAKPEPEHNPFRQFPRDMRRMGP